MRRKVVAGITLVLVLGAGFALGTWYGPASSQRSAGRDDAAGCAATAEKSTTSTSAPATTTAPGFVYDPDGAGPALPQPPLDGYDPLHPAAASGEGQAGGAQPGDQANGRILTYDPSGTQQGDTYTVFADLVAAAAKVRGGGTIFVPNDAVIDAPGTYDLNYFGFASNGSTRGFTRTILTIPDGVTFEHPGYFLAQGGIILYSTSKAAVVTQEASSYETSRMFILQNDGLIASKQAAFFRLRTTSPTSFIFFSLRHGGGIAKPSDLGIPGGDYESILAEGGQGAVVIADVAPPLNFYDGTVRGKGNIAWTRYGTDIPYQGTSIARGRSQPHAPAFKEYLLGSSALSVHDQANPEDWLEPDGSTTAASLDELACRVRALEQHD